MSGMPRRATWCVAASARSHAQAAGMCMHAPKPGPAGRLGKLASLAHVRMCMVSWPSGFWFFFSSSVLTAWSARVRLQVAERFLESAEELAVSPESFRGVLDAGVFMHDVIRLAVARFNTRCGARRWGPHGMGARGRVVPAEHGRDTRDLPRASHHLRIRTCMHALCVVVCSVPPVWRCGALSDQLFYWLRVCVQGWLPLPLHGHLRALHPLPAHPQVRAGQAWPPRALPCGLAVRPCRHCVLCKEGFDFPDQAGRQVNGPMQDSMAASADDAVLHALRAAGCWCPTAALPCPARATSTRRAWPRWWRCR